jgi:hypothetical protein
MAARVLLAMTGELSTAEARCPEQIRDRFVASNYRDSVQTG